VLLRNDFEEFTATSDEELYCQVCCCISTRSAF